MPRQYLPPSRRGRAGERTALINVWSAMMARCYTTTNSGFPGYGGRGIKVCPRWHDRANFLADVAPRPPGCDLHRKDSDGDYEPGNCEWLPRPEHRRQRKRRWQGPKRPKWIEWLGDDALPSMMMQM